jgi:hypothetical protein
MKEYNQLAKKSSREYLGEIFFATLKIEEEENDKEEEVENDEEEE